jgi:hypothetical protein
VAGLTYDSGALLAGERANRRLWALHARALQRRIVPSVRTVVLAQAWRGGPQPDLARLLAGCRFEPLQESDARASGTTLARSGTDDIIDAAVVVGALERQDAVVTSDRADLEHLARSLGRRLAIIDI